MSVVNWGLLGKSLVDPEKIEEAIARLILAHNEDETAHLGAGQSLQSHKASAIIDHVVASIIADKIKAGEVTSVKIATELTGKILTGGLIRTAASGERVEIEGGAVKKMLLYDSDDSFIGEIGAPYDAGYEGGLFQIKLGDRGVMDFRVNIDGVGYLNIFGLVVINTDDFGLRPMQAGVNLGGPNEGERFARGHFDRLELKNYSSIPNVYSRVGNLLVENGILKICIIAGTPGSWEIVGKQI